MVLRHKENGVNPLQVARARNVSARVAKIVRDSKTRRRRQGDGGRTQQTVKKSKKARVVKDRAQQMRLLFHGSNPTSMAPDPNRVGGSPETRSGGYNFPRTLPRPAYREISRELLEHIDPALRGIDVEFMRDKLTEVGPL